MQATTMPAAGWPGDLALIWCAAALLAVGAVLYVRRARRLGDTRGRRVRLVVGNLLVTLTLLGGLAAGVETWLRHGHDSTTWHAGNLVTHAWFLRHWDLNSQGFRDTEWPGQTVSPGPRVAVVGDSFTAGYGIADPADRFADRLRVRLGQGADLRLIASIGSDTPRQIDQLRAMFAVWRPQRVVLAYSLNDAEHLLQRAARDAETLEPAPPGSLANRSFLLDLLRSQWLLADSGHSERYFDDLERVHLDATRWNEQARLFRTMTELCRQNGATLDVAVFPLFSHRGPDYPFDPLHDWVLQSWRGAGAGVLDLRRTFADVPRDELVVGRFDAHPNERAHAMAANAIFDAFFSEGR